MEQTTLKNKGVLVIVVYIRLQFFRKNNLDKTRFPFHSLTDSLSCQPAVTGLTGRRI